MKILPLLCIFCVSCSWAEGEISPEASRVVVQSVVLDKDSHTETAADDYKDYDVYKRLNSFMSRYLQGCYPQTTRYKREDSSYPAEETFDDKTVERLLDALEELKEDTEKNQIDDKEKDDDSRKGRLDQVCKRGGSWHKKIEESQSKRRKGDMDGYKRILKDSYDDLISQNKDMLKRLNRPYRKKDWKEELERRRMRDSLSDSWPRVHDERMPVDLFFPMPFHHQPSHHRSYPSDYLP